MKKKLFFISILIISINFSVFSTIYSRPRKVSVLQTKYFDYIFPNGAEQTAYYLAKNGDYLFEEAANYFGLEKAFRIPVAISLDSEVLSGYYTSNPYNRITIFQAPAKADNINTDNTLLYIFNKAITEAVASSVKNKFWQFASDFLGMDALQPVALLNIPATFIDGVLEAYVDSNNEGIINDGFSLQILSQAKRENHFPSWIDATGGKDNYPTEISKISYAAFSAYIQQRWGLDKFKDFWKACGSVTYFTLTPGVFKKIYKISLKQAWNDFEESIPITETKDFGTNIFKDNTENQYSNIIKSNDNIIFYDSLKNNIYKLQNNKKTKLLIATNISNLSSSNDGRYLALSYITNKKNKYLSSNTTQIFDMERKFFLYGYLSIFNATFFDEKIDKIAIAGFEINNNQTQLKIYSFDNEVSLSDSLTISLPEGIQTESIVPLGIGKLLCIYYYKNNCILQTIDIDRQSSSYSKFPVKAKKFKIGYLQENKKIISFTYTDNKKYSLSKFGYFLINDDKSIGDIFLQKEEISGGIHDSCIINDEVFFSSHLSKHNELKVGRISDLTFYNCKISDIPEIKSDISYKEIPEKVNNNSDLTSKKNNEKSLGEFKIKKYRPLNYLFKGSWFPFFPISSFDFTKTYLSPGLGATYYTSSDPLETLTGGISFCAGFIDTKQKTFSFDNNYALAGTINTRIFPFDMSLNGIWTFDKNGKYDLKTIIGFSWNQFLGMSFHKLSLGLKGMWSCSTTYMDYKTNTIIELNNWPNIKDAYNTLSSFFSINYENYHQSGKSTFEQRGIEINTSLINIYDSQKQSNEDDKNVKGLQLTASISLGLKIPFIIPIFSLDDWVVCMPLSLYTKWYGENGTSSESYIETLLAGYEIQKGIPGINLYLNRFGIKLGYDIKTSYDQISLSNTDLRNFKNFLNVLKNSEIDDYFYINLELGLTPAIGKFSDSINITAGVQFQMNVRDAKGKIAALFNMNL